MREPIFMQKKLHILQIFTTFVPKLDNCLILYGYEKNHLYSFLFDHTFL